MSIQLQMEQMSGYLAARFIGTCMLEEIWRQFELIAETCKRANKNRLLLDFTKFHAGISFADRYFFVTSARIFAQYKLIKTAVVARPEQIDSKKFGELVARNRWINARVFTTIEDAEEWLLR
jgi:poly-beta-hydroxyalkanoate depolymerase